MDVTDDMVERAARMWCSFSDTDFDLLTEYQKRRALEDFRRVLCAAIPPGGDAP